MPKSRRQRDAEAMKAIMAGKIESENEQDEQDEDCNKAKKKKQQNGQVKVGNEIPDQKGKPIVVDEQGKSNEDGRIEEELFFSRR